MPLAAKLEVGWQPTLAAHLKFGCPGGRAHENYSEHT